ncbi:MAG: flagellar biosynthesis protein FlhB [Phycisphaerae bacterium]
MPADHDERTEPATPRKRMEARGKGQVARSQDISAAVLLLAGFVGLFLFGPALWRGMLSMVRAALGGQHPGSVEALFPLAATAISESLKHLAPILVLMFVALLVALYAQVGWLVTWQPLMPSVSKLNPLNGIKRLFGVSSWMLAAMNFGKLLFVGLVAYVTLAGSAAAILFSSTFDHAQMFLLGADLVFTLAMRLAVALLVLALADYAWQRYKHERDLRMTKEEVKDEMRSMEGDPQIKRRRRQVQLQLAMQRLNKDVPKADVVVTNPTHFAVAIRYDAPTMAAPKVVAKGADEIALRIRQIAASAGVPIVERKALARGLYDAVEVGDFVPERFYRAIAEILAYVYELTGQSTLTRTRPSQPALV